MTPAIGASITRLGNRYGPMVGKPGVAGSLIKVMALGCLNTELAVSRRLSRGRMIRLLSGRVKAVHCFNADADQKAAPSLRESLALAW